MRRLKTAEGLNMEQTFEPAAEGKRELKQMKSKAHKAKAEHKKALAE